MDVPLHWTRQYEVDAFGLKARLTHYGDKIVLARNGRDIRLYIDQVLLV
jgi:hypothetical protein